MDFKKILASLDAVEKDISAGAVEKKKAAGSMLAILENFNRVKNEETVEEAKPDFLDIDKDGDKKESMKKAAKDKEDKELEEAIMVSAEGDEAAQLLSILQLAGMPAPAPAMPMPAMGPMEPEMGPEMDMDMQDEYSNSPNEFEQDVDAVIANGNDLHREKDQYPATAPGDNPMRAFEGKFKAILDELLAEDEKKISKGMQAYIDISNKKADATAKEVKGSTERAYDAMRAKRMKKEEAELNEAAPAYSDTYVKTLKNTYGDKKTLSKSDMSKAKKVIDQSSNANIKKLASAGIPHVSDMAKAHLKNNVPGGMKKEQ
jgi:hypothetical protein